MTVAGRLTSPRKSFKSAVAAGHAQHAKRLDGAHALATRRPLEMRRAVWTCQWPGVSGSQLGMGVVAQRVAGSPRAIDRLVETPPSARAAMQVRSAHPVSRCPANEPRLCSAASNLVRAHATSALLGACQDALIPRILAPLRAPTSTLVGRVRVRSPSPTSAPLPGRRARSARATKPVEGSCRRATLGGRHVPFLG